MELHRSTFFFRDAMGPVAEEGEVGLAGGVEDGIALEPGRGPRTKFITVRCSAPVREAVAVLGGLSFEYTIGRSLPFRDLHLGRHMVRVWVDSWEGANIRVGCECALRDWSTGVAAGEYDDPFKMTIPVVILAELEASGVHAPLRIVGIERNQCTQYYRSDLLPLNADNSIPMVGGKDTVFRVYVAISDDASSPSPSAISGLLEVRQSGELSWLPLTPLNGPISPLHDIDIDRRNRDHTLNFLIPGHLCHGRLEYRARAYEASIIPREITSSVQRTITFHERRPLNIFAVAVRYTGPGGPLAAPSMMEMVAALSGIPQILPTPAVNFAGFATIDFDGDFMLPATSDTNSGPTWERLLDEIRTFLPGDFTVVAFVPGSIPRSDVAGSAIPGRAAAFITSTDPWIAVHEILHAAPVGIYREGYPWHDPCPAHSSGTDIFPAYVPFISRHESLPLGSIGEVGIDRLGSVQAPSTTFSIMSLCYPKWIDPRTYRDLYDGVGGAWLNSAQEMMDQIPEDPGGNQYQRLFLELEIERGQQVRQLPSFVYVSAALPESGEATDLSAEVRDAKGNLLWVTPIRRPPLPGNPEDIVRLRLTVDVPMLPGTAILRVTRKAGDNLKEVLSIRLSGAVPRVTVTDPGLIKQDQKSLRLQWKGSPSLFYRVRFSRDGGKGWRFLSNTIQETKFDVDLDLLAGGDACIFEVLASDGARTAAARTKPMRISQQPRRLYASASPAKSASGTPVLLTAMAFSASFGSARAEEVEWRSDKDDFLGRGQQVIVRTLALGKHTVKVTAPDGVGGKCTQEIDLEIDEIISDSVKTPGQ